MTDEDVQYETRTFKSLRGMESRAISKWEQDGWEVVSQSTGMLRSEITIRRPKPKSIPRKYVVVGGAVIAVLAAVAIVVGTIGENREESENTALENSEVEPAAAPRESPSIVPPLDTIDPSPSAPALVEETLTLANNAELATIVSLGDYCDSSIAAFANIYEGRTIAFDGNIGAMNNHDGATTRFDILIGAGDFSETSAPGPAFQFRDVNTTSDLNYVGEVADTIGVGSNLSITAEVIGYESQSCLFLLEPEATAFR